MKGIPRVVPQQCFDCGCDLDPDKCMSVAWGLFCSEPCATRYRHWSQGEQVDHMPWLKGGPKIISEKV